MGIGPGVHEEGNRLQNFDNYMEDDRFTPRERIALRYCDCLLDNPYEADEELWEELLREFTPAEVVELGHYIVLRIAGQRWIMSVLIKHGELNEFMEQKSESRVAAS